MKILEKIGKFVKEHKKEVIVGASAVGTAVLVCYGYGKAKEKIIDSKAKKYGKNFRAELESLDAERRELSQSTSHYKTATEKQLRDLGDKYQEVQKGFVKHLIESPCTNKEIKREALKCYGKSVREQAFLYRTATEIRKLGKPISSLIINQ